MSNTECELKVGIEQLHECVHCFAQETGRLPESWADLSSIPKCAPTRMPLDSYGKPLLLWREGGAVRITDSHGDEVKCRAESSEIALLLVTLISLFVLVGGKLAGRRRLALVGGIVAALGVILTCLGNYGVVRLP